MRPYAQQTMHVYSELIQSSKMYALLLLLLLLLYVHACYCCCYSQVAMSVGAQIFNGVSGAVEHQFQLKCEYVLQFHAQC
jgi:hypothetical protein